MKFQVIPNIRREYQPKHDIGWAVHQAEIQNVHKCEIHSMSALDGLQISLGMFKQSDFFYSFNHLVPHRAAFTIIYSIQIHFVICSTSVLLFIHFLRICISISVEIVRGVGQQWCSRS